MSAPHPLSVRAALTLCRHHHAPVDAVTVTGYLRPGPILNGPIAFMGLFDRNTVPESAADSLDSLLTYHGLGFFISNTSRLARSPILGTIHRNSRIAVTGTLKCTRWNGIQPTAIRVAESR